MIALPQIWLNVRSWKPIGNSVQYNVVYGFSWLMTFSDRELVCRDCGQAFVFTAGEQEFFNTKQLVNEPKRCPNCRLIMRIRRSGEDPAISSEVECAECGQPTRVPFQPKGHRPVYCLVCMRLRRGKEDASEQGDDRNVSGVERKGKTSVKDKDSDGEPPSGSFHASSSSNIHIQPSPSVLVL